jgi:hypothetical protein
MPEVKEVEFEVKFPTRHVEVNFPWEESIDSLHRDGFRYSFQMKFLSCFLERWDHPDGRYKLVAYKGGGLYMSEDVDDPHWKEIIDVIIDEGEPPVPLVSEDWFDFEIAEHGKKSVCNNMVRRLSSDEIPTTSAEWQKFARAYATNDCNCTISLLNGRSGETVFSDGFRRNRDGSVRKVAQKKPKTSR